MRGRLWCGLVCLLTSLSMANAADDKQDVQWLYTFCKDQNAPQFSLCLGYVSGVADMLFFVHKYNQQHQEAIPFQLCDAPSYGAIIQAFVNWAEKNPQYWGEPSAAGVMRAIFATWPCKGR